MPSLAGLSSWFAPDMIEGGKESLVVYDEEAMEAANHPQGNPDCGMSPITVESVGDLLYQEFAILTGAKSVDEHYLIIFPDRGNFHLLSDDDYRRLMLYLTSVPPMQDAESGFVLIVDRRNDKWNSVKTTLLRISSYFPGLIHRVFVLRPAGFLQKALSEVSSKLFRTDSLRFRLTVCNSVADLSSFIEPSQLTCDLGGTLIYDKMKWVQQRIEVEAFCTALQILSKDLKTFTEAFRDFEYPNDVLSTEHLIVEKEIEFERLRTDLAQAGEHGEGLLYRIKHTTSPESVKGSRQSPLKNGNCAKSENSRNSGCSAVQLINVISVERFIIQIDETARLFEEFWVKEKSGLEECLRLRRFEQDFRELQAVFDGHLKDLDVIPEMGDSLNGTKDLLERTKIFQERTSVDIMRAVRLEVAGREIVAVSPPSVDSVDPKCIELARMAGHFRFAVEEKLSKQRLWCDVQSTVEKANHVCVEGLNLLTATGGSESGDNVDAGTIAVHKLDSFCPRIQVILEDLGMLKAGLGSTSSSDCSNLVMQVLKRVEDVQQMCAKRRSSIVQQITRNKSRRSSGSSLLTSSGVSSFGSELKSAKSTSQLSEDGSSPASMKSGSSSLSLDGGINGQQREENMELKRVKRSHIINELLQTERTYVEEIKQILVGYRDFTLNPDVKSRLPQQLQPTILKKGQEQPSPNVSVLFCNLDEIYAFHSRIFLPDLTNCIDSVELVGLCFIQRHSNFLAMYSQYCQLLPSSENLRKDIGENHPWFITCRNRLGHKLPLGAYLLKPVQRITKYHLLIKDLVKHSEGCSGVMELHEALQCMLVVLRCVNDGMHQLSITGYNSRLADEGPLILQGPFLLWTETKKDKLRLNGHQRHLFLYAKSILICKKCQKSSSYEFRNKLNLSEVGLTEVLKGSTASRKFEIWVNGRQKVFVLQAETQEMKDIWVMEIKKLLLEQLESLRATKSATIPTVNIGVARDSAPAICTAAIKRNRMLGSKGVSVNGWRPQTTSAHRPLRQVCSWDNPVDPVRPKSRSGDSYELEGEDGWSSDLSNSDEEESSAGQLIQSGRDTSNTSSVSYNSSNGGNTVDAGTKLLALADYSAMSLAELSLREGDIVALVKIGCAGWWFVRVVTSSISATGTEGWAPSSFLEKWERTSRQNSLTSTSSSYGDLYLMNTQNNLGNGRPPLGYLKSTKNTRNRTSPPVSQHFSQSSDDLVSGLR